MCVSTIEEYAHPSHVTPHGSRCWFSGGKRADISMMVLRFFFQLHNQIEDTKGQARTYARVRPMNAQEKEGGCREVGPAETTRPRVGRQGKMLPNPLCLVFKIDRYPSENTCTPNAAPFPHLRLDLHPPYYPFWWTYRYRTGLFHRGRFA